MGPWRTDREFHALTRWTQTARQQNNSIKTWFGCSSKIFTIRRPDSRGDELRSQGPSLNTLQVKFDVSARTFNDYKWKGRSIEAHRAQIRKLVGFRKWSREFTARLVEWLLCNIIPNQFKHEHLKSEVLDHLRYERIEPPAPITLERIVNSALSSWAQDPFHTTL